MARGNKRARMEAAPAEEAFSDGSSGSSAAAQSGPSTSQPQFEMAESDDDDDDDGSEQEDDPEAEDSDEGPRAAQFLAESDLDDMSDQDSQQDSESEVEEHDNEKAEASTALEQLRSVPLGTLAKASQALDSGKKRKRSDAKSSAQDDATKAQAKAALDELRSHRKGRTAPRFQQGTSAEGADLSAKSEHKSAPERKKWKEVEHRANKHAPMVQTSKKAVSRSRNVVDMPKNQTRDPRFDTGELNEETFGQKYSFLSEVRSREISDLKARLAQAKTKKGRREVSDEDREDLERQLQSLSSRAEASKRQEQEKQALQSWKRDEKQRRSEGKNPYYLKKSQEKAMMQEKKLQELSRDKRKLRKHEMRKEKKQAGKEKKRMPPPRVSAQ